jgi:acyl-CoA thioesterase FadM
MSISTRWVVAEEHEVAPADCTADGAIAPATILAWTDAACRAYLDGCPVLEATRAGAGLELVLAHGPVAAPLPAAPRAVVTASATEVLPRAFVLSTRVRTFGGTDDQALSSTHEVRLVDPATGEAQELGTAIRDELTAHEHAARHFN